jgi:hypothetical protein
VDELFDHAPLYFARSFHKSISNSALPTINSSISDGVNNRTDEKLKKLKN